MGRPVSRDEFDHWHAERSKLPHPLLTPLGNGRFLDVVHSPIQCEVHKAFYPQSQVAFLPHAIQHVMPEGQISTAGRMGVRAMLGIPADRIVIASCGAVNAAKRAADVVFALCHLHDWGLEAHLYFVGEVDGDSESRLLDVASRLGLEDCVHFSGRVSEERYLQYLAAADVGVQLRLTLFGQLSGAVIDCIAAALPTVVPSSLGAGLEAPSFVARIPDTYTSLDVASALERVIASGRDSIDQEEWRDFVDAHSFERYGRNLAYILNL
jgi:glycosyltransferase involved in cell wall biosynthesis